MGTPAAPPPSRPGPRARAAPGGRRRRRVIESRRHLAPKPQAETTWGRADGGPRGRRSSKNWVGSERKGQSFGKVKEATVPHLVARVTGKKGTGGSGGESVDPSSGIVTERQSHAHSDTEMSTESQSDDTAPHSVATPTPLPFTRGHPTVIQGHHIPRRHTTQTHCFTTPPHGDAWHSLPVTPTRTHCPIVAQCSNNTQHNTHTATWMRRYTDS